MITNNCKPFLIDDITPFLKNKKTKLTDFDIYGLGLATCHALAMFNQQAGSEYDNDLNENPVIREEMSYLYETYLQSYSNDKGEHDHVDLLDGCYNTYPCHVLCDSMDGEQWLPLAFDNTWLTENGIMVMEFHPIADTSDLETINYDETIYIRIN